MSKDTTIEKPASFTQGEWTIRECPQGGNYEGGEDPFTISADGKFIASIKLQSRNTQANARLIAQAPAMYEQCKFLERMLASGDLSATHDGLTNCNMLAQLRELLAKVDGGEG